MIALDESTLDAHAFSVNLTSQALLHQVTNSFHALTGVVMFQKYMNLIDVPPDGRSKHIRRVLALATSIEPCAVQVAPARFPTKQVRCEHIPLHHVVATFQHKVCKVGLMYQWAARASWIGGNVNKLLPRCGPIGTHQAASQVMQLLASVASDVTSQSNQDKQLIVSPPLLPQSRSFQKGSLWLVEMVEILFNQPLSA